MLGGSASLSRRRSLKETFMVRMGRLPAALLLLSALAWLGALDPRPARAQAGATVAVDLELVLAVDVSLSIDQREARLQRQGYVEAFRDPLVIEAITGGILGRIAVTYFEWANSAHTQLVVGWTLIDSAASAAAFAAALEQRRPGPAHYTSISGALRFAVPLFDDNGFDGSRQVIDVSGDGPNNWGDLVTAARDRAVARGVTINGLPILDEGAGPFSRYTIPNLDLYYRDCVIGSPAAFFVVAENFEAFASAIRRKLILEIAGLVPPRDAVRGRQLAQAGNDDRLSPPCDIGEKLLRSRDEDF
jgi:hypothetical protein